mgnify:CR=1 FL=1
MEPVKKFWPHILGIAAATALAYYAYKKLTRAKGHTNTTEVPKETSLNKFKNILDPRAKRFDREYIFE